MSSNLSRRVFTVFIAFLTCCALVFPHVQKDQSKQEKAPSSEDKVYEAGGEVKSPKLVHYVEPAFSAKSDEAYVEGTVKLSTVITKTGTAANPQVLSGLNTEEDRTAVEALKQWKFEPGTKNGQPVNVRVTVEINFHLL